MKKVDDDNSGLDLLQDHNATNIESVVSSMSGQKKDKVCMVCGDRALGYNFNAISCESCKAFFRRNAHKTIRGRCEGKCDINVESRSFCKRCRLAKCFTVGMRKDMILNDDQKKVRKQKIVINKLRRQGHLPPKDTFAPSTDIVAAFPENVSGCSLDELQNTYPNLSEKDIDILKNLEKEKETETESACGLSRQQSSGANSYQDSGDVPWSEAQELIKYIISDMIEEEKSLTEELLNAHEKTFFLSATHTQLKNNPANPTEFVNIAEGFVRRIINLAKHISHFKSLNKDDQIALLKGSVVEIMMLRSAVNYDLKTESWSLSTLSCLSRGKTPTPTPTPSPSTNLNGLLPGVNLSKFMGQVSAAMTAGGSGENRISADLLKAGSSETQNLFLTYSRFIKSLMRTIHGDLLVLKFLIMLSLFSSDRQNVVNTDSVEIIQHKYAVTLQRYVKARFPEDSLIFAKILMKLTDLRNVNEVHTKMLLKMKLEDIEPLLIEVFDLPI